MPSTATTQEHKKPMPTEELAALPDIEAPPEEQMSAVIVLKVTKEDGSIVPEVMTQGDVQPTEVQTLMEVGLMRWRQSLGLTR